MNIFDFAMQMEKDGEQYYRNSAQKTQNAGLKKILGMLADAEVKHYDILKKMKENETTQLPDSEILSQVKNIFVKMKEENDTVGVNVSQIGLYQKAQDVEKKSQIFYLEKADEVKDTSQRESFLKIADEEKKHYFILENILNFVSRPQNWLENAEWYHLEEY
ncbi:ferritin-like protein [Candidatus Brocadia pituitae]|nr:ferritin-like protein [Candidatus Brocadia pituitae]